MTNSLSTVGKHLRRSPYQALSAMAVLTLTLFVATVFSLITLGSHQILQYFETRPQVTAFFKDTATQVEIDNLKKDIQAKDFVKDIKYVSKEEALAIYRQQNKNDPLLLEMVTADILPSSLEVSGISAQVLPQIAELLKNKPGVEEVVYQQDVVEALTSWTKALRLGGLILVGVLVATSILVIMVIIGMKISLRRHEIEVMKLIGASSWYIRSPYLVEGLLYGVVSAALGWGVAYIVLLYSTPFLASFLGTITILPVPFWIMAAILGIQIVFGTLIGTFGSFIAVRRFLR